ncbi:MAG: hypothetical protein P8Y97_09775 [Candidatus Lokiarchaeota archaeon]
MIESNNIHSINGFVNGDGWYRNKIAILGVAINMYNPIPLKKGVFLTMITNPSNQQANAKDPKTTKEKI